MMLSTMTHIKKMVRDIRPSKEGLAYQGKVSKFYRISKNLSKAKKLNGT